MWAGVGFYGICSAVSHSFQGWVRIKFLFWFSAACPRRRRTVFVGGSDGRCTAGKGFSTELGGVFIYVSRGGMTKNAGGHSSPICGGVGAGRHGCRLTKEKNTNTDVGIFFYFSSHFLREMGCPPPLAHYGGFATVGSKAHLFSL